MLDTIMRYGRINSMRHEKEWSFTDCTNIVLMERLGNNHSFAFDEHFKQFDKITVVP